MTTTPLPGSHHSLRARMASFAVGSSMRPPDRLTSFELVGVEDLTEPVEVLPCSHCHHWHVEIYRRDDGTLAVREWHDENCQHLHAVIREFKADDVG